MKRLFLIPLAVAVIAVPADLKAQVPIPLGVAVRIGGGVTRDGGHPGGIFSIDVGPFQGFAEIFKADGFQQANIGGNLIFFELPTPLIRPFAGAGGGFTFNSTDNGDSDGRLMVDGLAGVDLQLLTGMTFFVQAKYIYTFGDGPVIRDAAFLGGITFRLGL